MNTRFFTSLDTHMLSTLTHTYKGELVQTPCNLVSPKSVAKHYFTSMKEYYQIFLKCTATFLFNMTRMKFLILKHILIIKNLVI